MIFLGVDPGVSGAIAAYDDKLGDLIGLHKMPIDRIQMPDGGTRGRVSEPRLLELMGRYMGAKAMLERPEIRPMNTRNKQDGSLTPRRMSAMTAFAFGEGYGVIRMACTAHSISIMETRPGIWKGAMGVRGSKDISRRIASERYPMWASNFELKNSDGQAEAALIAEWASKHYKVL